LHPTEGRILFDDTDVGQKTPEERNIAQVFQFPVVYDTMTVYDNLAFPLKNRGVAQGEIDKRVREIAGMLDLTPTLNKRAAGLTADGKQKISLGRGLVRSDVNVIMFDEPLTVIDPHLKWILRSKLKELHTRIRRTMIYVTHDQTEALTFADQVVVMNLGEVVQVGTPVELFERPAHTFVGHFIGSPGMNALPCAIENGRPSFLGNPVQIASEIQVPQDGGKLELGIRPEFIRFDGAGAGGGIPVEVTKVTDAGRFRIVETRAREHRIRLLVPEGQTVPSGAAKLNFEPKHTHLYRDGWLVG
jgi:glycerol transport system ATP-binding protein